MQTVVKTNPKIKIVENDRYFIVTFPYDRKLVDSIKLIAGGWFHRDKKEWNIPKFRANEMTRWKRENGYVEPAQDQMEPEKFGEIPPLPDLDREIPGLLLEAYGYQRQGIAYNLLHRNVLIGDQPGLGKTAQAIVSVFADQLYPTIIVCPNSLKLNWQKEIKMWTGKRAMILSDKVRTSWPMYFQAKMCDFFIVNYESLEKFFVERYTNDPGKPFKLEDVVFKPCIHLFKALIVDESHKCKNPSTRQAKLVAGLARGKAVEMRLLLTGTAVVNSPKDLWAQFAILRIHGRFAKTQADFVRRYVEFGPKKKPANLRELNYYMHLIGYYRREKHEVLKDLPPKVRQIMICELTNQKEYDKAENEFIKYLQELKKCTPEEIATKLRGGFMVKMGILKHISAKGKLNEVREYIEQILEAGEKVVLFVNLIEMCNDIAAMFPDQSLIINGNVDTETRDRYVEQFQDMGSGKDVMVANYKAGGVGLTLTASSRVGIVEEPWTFADCEQCEDRCHRVGQKGMSEGLESIQCTYFLGKDTIDDYIHNDIVMEKKKIADIIHGATDQTAVNIVDNLLSIFAKRKRTQSEEAF